MIDAGLGGSVDNGQEPEEDWAAKDRLQSCPRRRVAVVGIAFGHRKRRFDISARPAQRGALMSKTGLNEIAWVPYQNGVVWFGTGHGGPPGPSDKIPDGPPDFPHSAFGPMQIALRKGHV